MKKCRGRAIRPRTFLNHPLFGAKAASSVRREPALSELERAKLSRNCLN